MKYNKLTNAISTPFDTPFCMFTQKEQSLHIHLNLQLFYWGNDLSNKKSSQNDHKLQSSKENTVSFHN